MDPETSIRLRPKNVRTCYVCGPDNACGLQVAFLADGAHGSRALYTARPEHEGWPGLLHGGVTFSLMDEALGWAVHFQDLYGVTARIDTRFRRPIPIGMPVVIKAWTIDQRRRIATARAEVRAEAEGQSLLAEADATIFLQRIGEREMIDQHLLDGESRHTQAAPRVLPERCVIVVHKDLSVGHAANAAAVVALTLGQRHPAIVGEPFVDGSGFAHPGLIPIGITVLSAPEKDLSEIRRKGLEARCDVVDFPREGQQTTNYQAFREATAIVNSQTMKYLAIALVGAKKEVNKIVGHLALLR